MPVRKFRSVEEMSPSGWYEPGSPALADAVRRLWKFGRQTTRRRYRPGVHRFGSIEEMQAAADMIVIECPE